MSRWVVATLLLALVIGLGAYGATNPEALDLVAELLAAFLGAAVAVWGAMWLTDHREDIARQDLRRILIDAVQVLLTAANAVTARLEDPKARATDEYLKDDLRSIALPWQHVAAFRPYRELRDFEAISLLAKLDIECMELVHLHAEATPQPQPFVDGAAALVHRMANRPVVTRTPHRVKSGAEQVATAAEAALRRLMR